MVLLCSVAQNVPALWVTFYIGLYDREAWKNILWLKPHGLEPWYLIVAWSKFGSTEEDCPDITEKNVDGRKESNQTNKWSKFVQVITS